MAGYQWTKTKPGTAGWYWFRGPAHECQTPLYCGRRWTRSASFNGRTAGFREVMLAKAEKWAGPIQLPGERGEEAGLSPR